MTALSRALALARKDLVLEWRGRQIAAATGLFALLVVLVLGLTLESRPQQAAVIPWVALGFALTLAVHRLVQSEVEQQALDVLLLYPGSREHLYWGKWAALVVMLFGLLVVLLPALGLLFNVPIWGVLPKILGVGVLVAVGLASAGTLFAALTLHVRGRELLLPLLLLPVTLPVLLAAIRLTDAAIAGASAGLWLPLLAAFDAVFLLACPVLFDVIMEDA